MTADVTITSQINGEAIPVCLIHYHEVGLKGRNRSYFEKLLQKNIALRLRALPGSAVDAAYLQPADEHVGSGFLNDPAVAPSVPSIPVPANAKVRRISGRLLVRFADMPAALSAAPELAQVPGVVRVSVGLSLPQDLSLIHEYALKIMASCEPYASFKVAARRANTNFPIDSMELNRIIGGELSEALPEKKVQMKDPDLCLHVEMIEGKAFVYAQTVSGIGGLPVGSAGSVVCLLSSGIDSPVAAWRILRRGAEVIGLHFSGRPETNAGSEYLVAQIAECLIPFGGLKKLVVVPFGSFQRQIAESVPPSLRVIFYRRLMFCVAETVAEREKAKALVTGESLGQVASQTLDNIRATNSVCQLPVLRPLIGSDKLEIIEQAERIGTFPISSQTADDCCTLFMPRNPETHARLGEVERIWEGLPVAEWIEEIINTLEYVDITGLN